MKKPRHKAPWAAKRARGASGGDEGDRSNKGRCSGRRKTEVVLRLFPDELSRVLGVTPGKLAEWRDEALAAMQAGLQSREPDCRDGFIHDLKARVGDQSTGCGTEMHRADCSESTRCPLTTARRHLPWSRTWGASRINRPVSGLLTP
jgi:hypothetical protein